MSVKCREVSVVSPLALRCPALLTPRPACLAPRGATRPSFLPRRREAAAICHTHSNAWLGVPMVSMSRDAGC